MKVWLELAVKNAKQVQRDIQDKFKNLDIDGLVGRAKSAQGAAQKGSGAADAAGMAAQGKNIGKIAGTAAAILGVLFVVKKIQDKMYQTLVRHSPYLQGILSVFGRAWSNFWRPFGDFLGNLLRPLAVALLRLSVKWLKFTRTDKGELVTKGGTGAMMGLGPGAGIGAIAGGIIGSAAGGVGAIPGALIGALIGGVIGSAVGAITALFKDAVQGAKNLANVIKEWLDYFMYELFGIDMTKVREKVATFMVYTLPEFFNETLPNWFNGAIDKLKDFGAHMWEGLTGAIKNLWPTIKDFASHVWNNITDSVSDLWENLTEWVRWLWQQITQPLSNLWNTLSGYAETVWGKITNPLSNVWNKLRNFASHVWDKLTSPLSNIYNWLSGIGRYMYNKVTDSISDAFKNFKFGWSWWWKQDSGHQTGLNYVPSTGMYLLHKGETVTNSSRTDRQKGSSVIISPTFNISGNARATESELNSQIRRAGRMLEFEVRRRNFI